MNAKERAARVWHTMKFHSHEGEIVRATWTGVLNEEGSWGSRKVADAAEHEMILYPLTGKPEGIEWVIGTGDVEYIGLEWTGGIVTGYDGVMSLPDQAIALLIRAGITVVIE